MSPLIWIGGFIAAAVTSYVILAIKAVTATSSSPLYGPDTRHPGTRHPSNKTLSRGSEGDGATHFGEEQ